MCRWVAEGVAHRLRSHIPVAVLAAAVMLHVSTAGARDVPAPVDLLQQLLRIDTSNPPGDTQGVALALKSVFDAAGIDNEIIVAPNGKAAHFIARLRGNGSKRPVLLAAHTDVVPVEREHWTVDPFAGVIKDGYIYGRGTLDNKGAVAAFAHALLQLEHNKVALARDVIFLAEADEEQGEFNTGWLARNHWQKIDAEFALNEGGSASLDARGRVRLVTVSTADKVTVNLQLTARGKSGHSSRPLPLEETANGQLVTAMARLMAHETEIQLPQQTRDYLNAMAQLNPQALASPVRRLLESNDDAQRARAARAVIQNDVIGGWGIEGMLRNTLVVTMMDAGVKANVIPASATATLNARLMPGTDIDRFIGDVRKVIGNTRIEVNILHRLPKDDALAFLRARSKIAPSRIDTDLFAAIRGAAAETWPGVTVLPTLLVAATDATPWRERGVPVYGLGPFPSDADTASRIHGNDERVALQALEQGADFIYGILEQVAQAE